METATKYDTWHGGPPHPTITCIAKDRLPWNRGSEWRLWIPPIGLQCYETGAIGDAIMDPWGDTYWPTQQDACDFLEQVVLETEPICGAGHPLIVLTKGTFWLTAGAVDVERAVVLADVGDAGNFDPHPFTVWGCNARQCNAPITEGAQKAAITRADGYWSCLLTVDGKGYVEIEG